MNIEFYKPMLEFLSSYLGSESEVLLCDTEKILLAYNPFEESNVAGQPIPDILKSFLINQESRELPYTVNYRTMTSSREKLRSATMFIREDGNLVGFLTLNTKVTNLIHMREIINTMINGEICQPVSEKKSSQHKALSHPNYYETLTLSISEIIDTVVNEASQRYQTIPKRFTIDEKLKVMRNLDDRGVFLVKGSIAEVATKMQLSEATVYRYLHQIAK